MNPRQSWIDRALRHLGLVRASHVPHVEFDFQTRFIRLDFGDWRTQVQGWVQPTPDAGLTKIDLPSTNPFLGRPR